MQTENVIIVERLKFYADTETQKNKYFCFKINSIMDLENRLKYWIQRVIIKAAWYECLENGKVISNDKIDIQAFYDTNQTSFIK